MYEPKVGETVWFLFNYGDGDDEVFKGTVTGAVVQDERYPYHKIRDSDGDEYLVFSECVYKTESDLLQFQLKELYRERMSLNNRIERMEKQINELYK